MGVNKQIRVAQHRHHFYPHELVVLGDVCLVLGIELGDLTRAQASDYVSLFYNAPHSERDDPEKAMARLRLGASSLVTFCRSEFGRHRHVPGFTEAVKLLVLGAGEADDADEATPSIMRDLESVIRMAKRGA